MFHICQESTKEYSSFSKQANLINANRVLFSFGSVILLLLYAIYKEINWVEIQGIYICYIHRRSSKHICRWSCVTLETTGSLLALLQIIINSRSPEKNVLYKVTFGTE